ncbi:ATP-binding cassette sub-family C member 10-like [Bolinopsis microptera]|uniref:ATP-binding cassette sub-family C member 10-like n=1 Tax=Bolinopsis microptera TaxID=2820187 RepID=UPI00307A9BE7
MSSFLDVLCKNEEPSLIWEGNDFGGCFEKVVVISPVYVIMSFICSFFIFKASCSSTASGILNRVWVLYLRLVLHAAIICTQIALFVEQCFAVENIQTVEIVAESLILLAWCLSAFVIFIWRRSWHSVSSGRDFDILIASWFLAFISCSFELHSAILSTTGSASALDEDTFKDYEVRNIYTRFVFYVGILLSQVIKSNVPVSVLEDEGAGSSRGTRVQHSPTEESASFISRISFHWVKKLFTVARESQFPTVEHLPFDLPTSLNPAANHCNLQLALKHYSQPDNSSSSEEPDITQPLIEASRPEASDKLFLVRSINRAFGWTFWPLNLIKMLELILNLSVPVILNLFLHELERSSPNLVSSGLYLTLLVVVSTVKAFVGAHLKFELRKLGMRLKGALISELFSKVLNINFARLRSFSVGQISNFATEDANAISSHLYALMDIWAIPLELIIILVLLYHYIGMSFLSVLGFCILTTPLNIYVTSKFEKHEDKLMKQRDDRLKLIYEIFANIKTVKFFSWEESLIAKLLELRNVELTELKAIAVLDAGCVFLWAIAPSLITTLTIGTYSLLGGEISVSMLFTTLALVSQMVEPLNMIPWVLLDFAMAWVSTKRVQTFFCLSDNSPTNNEADNPLGENSIIEMDNCSFYWEDSNDCCLARLQFQVNKGELMIVMGKSGSGKSSLLLALSQELNIATGVLRLKEWKDGAGIVLQDCWIKSGSVREAILDGCVFDLYWYETVVSACALDEDIAAFSQGDESPVGVNGSLLSGGQRLRLSLARAVYKNKQVYLIDDIFSSLDAHVVHHIFENCINGILASKTRVVCTHNKSLSASANTLMVLDEGQIRYIGPPQVTGLPPIDDTASPHIKSSDVGEDQDNLQHPYVEPRSFGAVNSSVYGFYLQSAGYTLSFLVVLFLFCMQASDSAGTIWLSLWAKAVSLTPGIREFPLGVVSAQHWNTSQHSSGLLYGLNDQVFKRLGVPSNSSFYLEVYGSIIAGNIIFSLGRVLSFIPFQIAATKILHNKMLMSIMQTPLHFFDATPLGVIINRFSSDVYTVDSDVPIEVNIFAANLCYIVGVVVVTCYGLPYIIISFVPLSVFYFFIQRYYRRAVREVKRLYSMSQSPLFSHFEETLGGVSYIHSFRSSAAVQNTGMKILKTYQRAEYCLTAANVWLRLRLELLTALVIAFVSCVVLIQMKFDNVDASRLGLGLTLAFSISQAMDYLISSFTDLEKSFVAAERVMQFTENLPREKESDHAMSVYSSWPELGNITFSAVTVRYKNCTTRALNNVNISIRTGEKVAIVGRTGAGKSTLFLALFKLVDLERGSIIIDDVNITEISNKSLRKSLTIIPQQPLIFSGTLRDTLDPFSDHSDEELKAALRQTEMVHYLNSKDGLNSEVALGTLSTGESQLISLARAFLRKSRIVCLDEATSNVDSDTEQLVQRLLQNQLSGCTVLAIAHRIETVLDYDRVIVMSQGSIVEEGDPRKLLQKSSSHFHLLAKSSGLASSGQGDSSGMMKESLSIERSHHSSFQESSPTGSGSSHQSYRPGSVHRSSQGSSSDIQ